ncbi:MAG TPA: acyl-CoA thioesterase [Rhodanobacteraceae bacterium]
MPRSAARRPLAERALITATLDVDVPFQDVDGAQIIWHGNYFRYFEAVRAQLLRRINYDYPQMLASGYAWPVVDAQARFLRPIRYAQRIRILAGLVEWANRLKVDYLVSDPADGTRLATGTTVQCAVTADTWQLQLASPAALIDRLKPWL